MCVEVVGLEIRDWIPLRIWMMVTGKGGPCLVRPGGKAWGAGRLPSGCGYKSVCTVTVLGEIYRCFLVCFFVDVYSPCVCAQWCPTLCDPMGCSPSGCFVHGISQARILEWVAISRSRGSSWPRDPTLISCVSCIGRQILYPWATWEAPIILEH